MEGLGGTCEAPLLHHQSERREGCKTNEGELDRVTPQGGLLLLWRPNEARPQPANFKWTDSPPTPPFVRDWEEKKVTLLIL